MTFPVNSPGSFILLNVLVVNFFVCRSSKASVTHICLDPRTMSGNREAKSDSFETTVDIYVASVPVDLDSTWLSDVLDDAERAYHRSLKLAADRSRFVAGHVLLRSSLAARTGVPASAWRFEREGNGRWRCAAGACHDVHFSIAHAGKAVAVALSADYPVGVDIEPFSAAAVASAAAVVFSARELAELEQVVADERPAASLMLWTLKESYAKMLGLGIELDFASVEMSWRPPGLVRGARGQSGTEGARLSTLDVALDDGAYCVALAVGGPKADSAAINLHVSSSPMIC
jgi:4'-phosphopantetheinyl transferase